jgi:hypothetical protein
MKRLLATAVLVALASASRPADADDDACIAAAEQALTLRKEQRLQEALVLVAACVDSACPTEVRAVCERRASELEAAMPTLVFVAHDGLGNDLTAVKVTVDGALLTARLDGRAWRVDPGPHVFRWEAAGFLPVEKTLLVSEGAKERREVVTFAAPSAQTKASAIKSGRSASAPGGSWDERKTAAVVAGAAAIAGLGVGLGFGWATLTASQDQNNACSSHCTSAGQSQATAFHDRAVSDGTVSDIAFAVGGVAAVGALVIWLTGPRVADGVANPDAKAHVSASFDARGAAISLLGRWE